MGEPPPSLGSEKDFHRERFLMFRMLAIRMGFLVACLPGLTILPSWILNPELSRQFMPLRGLGTLLWSAYPLGLRFDAPRRLLPWLLFGPATAMLLLLLSRIHDLGPRGAELGGILALFYIFPPMLGIPLSRKENALGLLLLVLLPNLMGLLRPGLGSAVLQLNLVAIPVSVTSLYLQRLFDDLLADKHAYLRQVEEMAHRDALTGAFNRRHFMEAGAGLLRQGHRYHHPLSLLILDIDHFKGVNDRFGHPAGDAVIRAAARTMMEGLRDTDLVARLGGEEFVALLPESDEAAGLQAAERVRRGLEALDVQAEGVAEPLRVTASLGVAEARGDGETLERLLGRADEALYAAKRGGRNRVVAWRPDSG